MYSTTDSQIPHSLQSAAVTLLEWAQQQDQSLKHLTQSKLSACRLQVPVSVPTAAMLPWLRTQPSQHKLYFRARHSPFQIAAVGFSHQASGKIFTSAVHRHLLSILDDHDSNMRFYGGVRFHNVEINNPGSDWIPYDGYTFVLPALELFCDAQSRVFLAANYYPPAGVGALRTALTYMIRPSPAIVTAYPPLMIPRAHSVHDLTDFDAWDRAMSTILNHLSSHRYDKIVLARRKRFVFHENTIPDPLHILSALAFQNSIKPSHVPSESLSQGSSCEVTDNTQSQTNAYLFCLQVDHDKAFLGCTPELLFKLDDQTLLTEALAGTVRRVPHDNEEQALETLLNEKNVREHQFVVDYVTAAISRCGFTPHTDGPHIRRLPRLMHLATHVSATLPPNLMKSAQNDIFRLLSELHPTPAVCGVPQDITLEHIADIERFDRGLFAGPFGWFSSRASDFCVAIRSATVHGPYVTAYAGSGIVHASESSSEWDETELKLSAFTDLFSAESTFRGAAPSFTNVNQTTPRANQMNGPLPADRLPKKWLNVKTECHLLTNESVEVSSPKRRGRPHIPAYFDPSELERMSNLNELWGCCVVEELCRNGVFTFFVAPGSRSAPLAIGVARSRHVKVYVAHDERGAGYLAVGYARATGRAAAVVTSSGTAVANLLPAVVEAYMDGLPMILLTADRPPELQDVGANQSIRQPNIFGSYVIWSKEMACPCEEIPLKSLLSDVDYAVYKSGSESGWVQQNYQKENGPVHLNFMFRESLAPDESAWNRQYLNALGSKWRTSVEPLTLYRSSSTFLPFANNDDCEKSGSEAPDFWKDLKETENGVIVLAGGPGSLNDSDETLSIYEIADLLHWPIVSDVCGGLRLDSTRPGVVEYADLIFASSIIKKSYLPNAVLQFGERITSKRVKEWIRSASVDQEGFMHVLVSNSFKRSDEHCSVTHRVHGNVATVRSALRKNKLMETNGTAHNTSHGLMDLMLLSLEVRKHIERRIQRNNDWLLDSRLNEPKCAHTVSTCIGKKRVQALFVGNSMPIRDIDSYGQSQDHGGKIRIVANRGASGIDGVISSGIGFALGQNVNTTIFVGDMSMLHDLNSLHLLRDGHYTMDSRVTIVVVNNGGGGIFSMLPIAKHQTVFSPLFDTPHSVNFEGACKSFGMPYVAVETESQLRNALCDESDGHRFIEALVSMDHAENAQLHCSLKEEIVSLVEKLYPRYNK